LAIVKKIVEEHGGLIRLQSPPEGGACVEIRFPASTVAREAPAVSTQSIPLANIEDAR
jgi:signal transduction histidine kinase